MSHFAYFIVTQAEKLTNFNKIILKYLEFANNKSEASTLQTQRKQTINQNKKKDNARSVYLILVIVDVFNGFYFNLQDDCENKRGVKPFKINNFSQLTKRSKLHKLGVKHKHKL